MQRILNLWLVLEGPNGSLKVVKNSDKFLSNASKTLRQRADLAVDDVIEIPSDGSTQSFKLLFKAPDEAKCQEFIRTKGFITDVYKLCEEPGCEEQFVKMFFNSPTLFPEIEKAVKVHHGEEDFNVQTFLPLITKNFKLFFGPDTNLSFNVTDEYNLMNTASTFYDNTLASKAKIGISLNLLFDLHLPRGELPFKPTNKYEDTENVAMWKLSKKTDVLSVGDLDELFDPEYLYLVWRVSKKAVDRSDGKVWFKKFNNPSERIEMDMIFVSQCMDTNMWAGAASQMGYGL